MDCSPGYQEVGGISDMLQFSHNIFTARMYNSGFLLIEMMITYLLISIVLIALAKFQVVAIQDNSLAKSRTVAVNLAQNKLESLRNITDSITYQAINNGSDSVGPPGSGAITTLSGLITVYTRTWTVSGGITPNDMRVEVIVTWPDEKGAENSNTRIMLSSAISNFAADSSGKLF
jgi:Tfp pilus assembly protein PilV